VLAQPGLELPVGLAAPGEQAVGPRQRRLVPLGQLAVLMVVGDVVDEILGETGLTGLVEADLSSEATIGHPRVA
jgi:hypothetical protein